ncbi:MAG: DUF1552 domain-containing protein, partial [Proteobacteria bacterium]
MKYNKLTRRMFLEGAGKTALAIPFLSSLMPTEAKAATVSKKFVSIQSDYFIARELATPGYYDAPGKIAWTQVDADQKYQLLSDHVKVNGKISQIFDQSWNPYADKINIISNSNAYIQSFLHNATLSSSACSGSGGDYSSPIYSYSTDFLAEQGLAKAGVVSGLGGLRINLWGSNDQYDTTWGTINGKAQGLQNAKNLTQLQTMLAGANTTKTDQKQVTRRKLIDAVMPELNRLKANARMSKLDKDRLNEATDRWNDIQNRAATSLQCSFAERAQGVDWEANHRQAMSLAIAALSCNMTNVINYTLFAGGKENPQSLHNYAHDARNRNFNDVQLWRSRRVADFVGMLNATKDENGQALLDSSMLQWMHEYSSWGHQKYGYVTLTAGGAGGAVRTGLHLDVGGTPINTIH